MTRTQDKIKDFVDPQAYEEVRNLFAEPARALAAYRFTDVTSDLLARWLDALADLPRGEGAAYALAGMRGVGKSHALAAFGAMIATPELRPAIADAHVAVSARRLTNRRYTVVHIERGTQATLDEEAASAFSVAFGGESAAWGAALTDMLASAANNERGAQLVLVVDTAYGRETRVNRDDGPLLSELAVAAKEVGAFIALALDDDIAGAEGVNSALARTYQIDYLEPEHLYQVVNNYLLRKHDMARTALHDIYLSLRASVPGFNWSEPRFAALYPLHPLVADVAAAVRLHAPTFAFLPFAAVAGQHAVNRPALSLILLDEVFDRTEKDLRRASKLQEAFKVFDELAAKAVGQFPAMQRLQVRLILKSLFILSLDGRGATARELCAALLFQNEAAAKLPGAEAAVTRVEEVLRRLSPHAASAAANYAGLQSYNDDGETRYRFQSSVSGNGFNAALAAAVEQVASDEAPVSELLRALTCERFTDWPHGSTIEPTETFATAADFAVTWRGTLRPGRLINHGGDAVAALLAAPDSSGALDRDDWEMIMLAPEDGDQLAEQLLAHQQEQTKGSERPILVVWRPAAVTQEEAGILRRLRALRTDAALGEFGEPSRAAASALAAQAEGIWIRLYVDDGVVLIDGDRFRFTAEARSAKKLSATLAQLLRPFFAKRYPQHPAFGAILDETAAANLSERLFGGGDTTDADAQSLVRSYALPLGLAVKRGETCSLEVGDETLQTPWMKAALALIGAADNEGAPLAALRKVLRRAPFGFLRETQNLIVVALVAQRRAGLVTAAGDVLSRRTLRRAIDWAQVTGVRAVTTIQHNEAELIAWARLLTGQPSLATLDEADDGREVRAALAAWLTSWHQENVVGKFHEAPAAGLTTRAWTLAMGVQRTFGNAAEAVETVLADEVALEEALQRVADAFANAMEVFTRRAADLDALAAYTSALHERERTRAYLIAADVTGINEIESARRELLLITEDVHTLFDPAQRERCALLWRAFQLRYTEHYAEMHDRAVGSAGTAGRAALEELTRGDLWREFESLARLPFINRDLWDEATAVLQHVRQSRCDLPVQQFLTEQPRCACAFHLTRSSSFPDAATTYLEELAGRGCGAARRTLALFLPHLSRALNLLTRESPGADTARRAYKLAEAFTKGQQPEAYTSADVRLITRALELHPAPQPLRVHAPTDNFGLLTREELAEHLRQWIDDLPIGPALVELIDGRQSNVA
ncbi:MAG: hypothetical protein H0T45_18990 [Pyrinomonadaceae bacterium]|nr:hypothetical protein [Pyrinomonadaceae bacterium]